MQESKPHVVIIGAGHAGGTVAALLRQYEFTGPITLIGEEPIPPYHRPPLSKAWLKGEANAESLALKPLEFYAENNIDLWLNARVARVDRVGKKVAFLNGNILAYDILIIATGSRAIYPPIPRADSGGIMLLRTAADAEQLKATIGPGKRLAIVGGGYIGLEVAASVRGMGAEVVILEREERILKRVANPILAKFFQSYHEARGVTFELGCHVASFGSENGQVTGVWLGDGRGLLCDAVVIGAGVHPNEDIAKEAGLECDHGILVDLEARTSDPYIFAIGDVTRRPMPIYDCLFRMESVPNALEQAKQAAAAITGRPAPAVEVPWQWSDQYDLKMQIAGYPFEADTVLVRGEPTSAKFALFHLKGDQVQAVEAINSPPEFMMGRQLIGSRKAVDRVKLADPTISMKEVVAERDA
ncbi:MAG: FAD-dependent oxidoreductase [Asticcacaulis sp.]|uniref:NAD(P)/FAD-dependent oxidoreductase n=1 Tax=Asticcacaulis sp. TaxID=1872648 RepID=UPI0039E2E51A